jgi:hypothetical protein
MAPYVFHPNDPYPCRERQILMGKPVASNAIARSVFKRDELTWIDGWVADRMGQPELWVQSWSQLLSLRAAGLRVKLTRVGNRRGWQYNSKFLAWFSIQHTVVALTLQPGNRPALAAELRKHPYEAEVFRGDRFAGSAVAGVLAESGGLPNMSAPPADLLVRCGYCSMSYKQTEPRCTNCGAVN